MPFSSVLESVLSGSWETIIYISSQFHVQWLRVGSLKKAIAGVFTPWKSKNAMNQSFFFLQSCFSSTQLTTLHRSYTLVFCFLAICPANYSISAYIDLIMITLCYHLICIGSTTQYFWNFINLMGKIFFDLFLHYLYFSEI